MVSVAANAQINMFNSFNFDPGSDFYGEVITIDTINYKHNVWQIGRPGKPVFSSAFSAPYALVTDTLNPFPQSDTSVFILKLPWVNPGINWPIHAIGFKYRLDIDTGIKVTIELTSDTLHNWVNVKNDTLPYGFHLAAVPNLDSSTIGWQNFTLHQPEIYLGHDKLYDTLLVRFTIISDSSTAGKDGWIIDDIVVSYEYESVPLLQNPNLITLYPNPSHGNLYFHRDKPHKDATITIYDMQGRQVYNSPAPANGYLNLQLPDGVYTLKYSDEEEYCVKQVVIKN
jgi:hypothetical protein